MTSERVSGKVALVTGAASGIGLASARALVKQGAMVVLTDVDGAAATERARSLGSDRVRAIELDVSSPDSWEVAVAECDQLDVLVNNAGVAGRGTVADTTASQWRRVMSVNLDGVFFGMHAALPHLRAGGGGSIINVSSIAGLMGFRSAAAYSASKWGVVGLTKTAALDHGAEGVRVNSIHPGSIETPLTAGLTRGIGQIPAGRVGQADEVGDLVVFLASEESRFINGASIAIDGGETAGNNIRGLL